MFISSKQSTTRAYENPFPTEESLDDSFSKSPLKEKNSNSKPFPNKNLKTSDYYDSLVMERKSSYSVHNSPKYKFCFDFSNIEVLKSLGDGKYGSILLVRDRLSNFILVMKFFPVEELISSGVNDRVSNEIKVSLFAKHPNVIKTFGLASDGKNVALLEEYCPEGSLFCYLSDKKDYRLEEKESKHLIKSIIEGIKYFHSFDVIHRDIKPENIFMIFGEPKIGDFGLSACIKQKMRASFCGTVDYMSPEVLTRAQYGKDVDLWCLGVLIYEIIVGKPPFTGYNEQQVMKKIMRMDMELPEFISIELRDMLRRLIDLNPQKRMDLQRLQAHPWLN